MDLNSKAIDQSSTWSEGPKEAASDESNLGQWIVGNIAVSDGSVTSAIELFTGHQIRDLSGDELPADSGEVHLQTSAVPAWFRDLPKIGVSSGVPAAVAGRIVDDLARQPLTRYRGRRPLSPIERLNVPLVELSAAIERSLLADDHDDVWAEMLRGRSVNRLVEPTVGLFRSATAHVSFTGAPGEIHPQIAVQRIRPVGSEGTDPTEIMVLAEADALLGVSIDLLSGPRSDWRRTYVWARRYELSRAVMLRFRSDPRSVASLGIPLLQETAWGVDVSGDDPLQGMEVQTTLSPPAAVRVVTGAFVGERLHVGERVISPGALARTLVELRVPFDAIALATSAASPSAALGYARALAGLLDVPVVAADGGCHVESDGLVTAVRRQTDGAASSLGRWYVTEPGGAVPRQLGRHSLGSALQQL